MFELFEMMTPLDIAIYAMRFLYIAWCVFYIIKRTVSLSGDWKIKTNHMPDVLFIIFIMVLLSAMIASMFYEPMNRVHPFVLSNPPKNPWL